ncbi:MAG TPA: hypothetical protein VIC35_12355 [Acidimicrobiia bacterium]|jgi:hypothetical protein
MRRALVALSMACVIGLAACGGSGGSSTGPAPTATGPLAARLLSASADKATEAKTGKMRGYVSLDAAGKFISIPINGAFDVPAGAFEMQMDMSSLGIGGSGTVDMRLVDKVVYLNIGDLLHASGAHLPAELDGKKWLALNLAQYAQSLGGSGSLGGLQQANPANALESLRGVGTVTRIGTETIDGSQTTHYRTVIDPDRAAAAAPPDQRARIRLAFDEVGAIPVDVWIDGQGRTRKFSMIMDIPGEGDVNASFEFYDYGDSVDVSAPPADEVADASSLLGSAGLGTSG